MNTCGKLCGRSGPLRHPQLLKVNSLPPYWRFVEFEVSDTGIGIAQDKLKLAFDKFYQVDSSETRLYGGTRLGLYAVKQFAELVGGSVEVRSEASKGSTFTVRIPCENVTVSHEAYSDQPTFLPSTTRLLLTVLVIVFVVEALVMLLLPLMLGEGEVIVEAEGKLWAESEEGKRTTFTFSLPLRA